MGTDWFFFDMEGKEYLQMPKEGEWPNEMYKLIEFFKSARKIVKLPDYDEVNLPKLLKECEEFDCDWDEEIMFYICQAMVESANVSMWDLYQMKERENRKKFLQYRDRENKSLEEHEKDCGHCQAYNEAMEGRLKRMQPEDSVRDD